MGITQRIGAAGEQAAERWLAIHDFEIVARNWRSGRYELDIVALKNDTLHFVEVKSRDADGLQTPEEALTPAKQRSFCKAAQAFLVAHPSDREVRLDLIAVDTTSDDIVDVRYIPEAVIPRW